MLCILEDYRFLFRIIFLFLTDLSCVLVSLILRPETEEEKLLKERINQLKKVITEENEGTVNKDSEQISAEQQTSLHEQISQREKDLEKLIRDLDDKVLLARKPIVLVPAGLHFLQIRHLLSLVFLRSQRVRTSWIDLDLVVALGIHGVLPWMTKEAFKEEGKQAILAAEAQTGTHKVLFIFPKLLE